MPRLTDIPGDPRDFSLWMQHGVGYLLMRQVRDEMYYEIESDVAPEHHQAARSVVNDTIYKMCMLVEGIGPPLRNDTHSLEVDLVGRLVDNSTYEYVHHESMFEGDGICVGYHGWMQGDFGTGRARPVADPGTGSEGADDASAEPSCPGRSPSKRLPESRGRRLLSRIIRGGRSPASDEPL